MATGLEMASSGASAQPEPLCKATLQVSPPTLWVGQPLHYAVFIEQSREVRRLRFDPALRFPAFRSEWLPTQNVPDTRSNWRTVIERRVLLAAHGGRLPIPSTGLVCEAADRQVRIPIDGLQIEVREPPVEGRPANWTGVVGPVEVSHTVTPRRVALGESVRLSLRVAGPGNVWRADPGLQDALAELPVDLFELNAETERDAGRSLLFSRYMAYDLVPREVGIFTLPGLEIAYFDPGDQKYATATLPPMAIEILPRRAAAPSLPAEAAANPKADTKDGPWLGVVLSALVAVALTLFAFWRVRKKPADPWPAVEQSLRDAQLELEAEEIDQAAASYTRALQAALRILLPEAQQAGDGVSTDALLASAREREETAALVVLIERFERARFAAAPDAAEIRAAASDVAASVSQARGNAS